MLGTGYAKGNLIEAFTIDCCSTMCVELKSTIKKTLVNGGHSTVVEQSTTLCEIEGLNPASCVFSPRKFWQKNKAECIILGTGYAKGNQIVVFTIDCCCTMWIKK